MTHQKPVRIALVGCGAVSRENLLPVLAGHDGIRLGPLVDRDERRARELADAYGVASVLTDGDLLTRDQVDAVILATPPVHHAPATIAAAAKGLHVFVEKPMAIKAADARAMVTAAEQANVRLSVGLYRRFLPSVQLLRTILLQQEFGRPLAVDAEEGGPYGWQLATLDVLRRATGGGGPLIDLGSHLLDLILYVLGATPSLKRYRDNELGGIETDCILEAGLTTPTGEVPLRLELSRTRELRGSVKVRCEHATLELRRANFTSILIHRHDGDRGTAPIHYTASWPGQDEFVGYEAFRREIDDFVDAIHSNHEPVLSGRSVVPVVALIEDAYAKREKLIEPANDDRLPPAVHDAVRKRVLITGAGGFLGGRAVDMLRDGYGFDTVPLVREPKSAARLARRADPILLGDVCSRPDMDRVMKDVDAVVHCAVGTSWRPDESRRVTVEGTRTAAEAALAAGVKRFVHISTLFVHQRDGVSSIDERTPLNPPAHDTYGQAKLEAEKALAEVGRKGLSTIVIRPTRIYGPFSRTFTLRPLQALSEGRLAIGGTADVPSNMVYVDNVVAAIARALDAASELSGSAFLITDDDQLPLKDFYEYFGSADGLIVRVLPDSRENSGTDSNGSFASRLASGVVSIAKSSELRGLVRRVFETDPIGTLPRQFWDRHPRFQQRMLKRFGADAAVVYRPRSTGGDGALIYYGESARVSGAKAARELGFVAAMTRDQAMARTLEWARYARVLPGHEPV